MMKKISFFVLFGMWMIASLFAQNQLVDVNDDRVLMTIGNHPVTVGEFMTVYSKNNVGEGIIDKKTPDEYLQLYIDFKLKVFEAKDQKMDTLPSFRKELAGYRKQLAAPYFDSKVVEEQLLDEAYAHTQEDLRAAHILVLCDEFAAPEDTLAAWKKIEKLRQRVLKGEDFYQVAWEASEDPSARDREARGGRPASPGNRGDLGYFTAFNMIYPFEKAAYNTPMNEISPIVRTSIGYHILKVTDRRAAMGKVTAAHIFFKVDPESTQKQQDSVLELAKVAYQRLKNGESWNTVIKLSNDEYTRASDGVLPPFTVSRMVPEFIVAVRDIKNIGDFTEPIKTSFGYHIIRLDQIEPVASKEAQRENLQKRIKNDMRYQVAKESVIEKIKQDHHFTESPNNIVRFLPACDTASFNEAKWSADAAKDLNFNMFQIGDSSLSAHDFAQYIAQKQTPHVGGTQKDMEIKLHRLYKAWVEETCRIYAEENLEKQDPKYHYLLQEYSDGMLLFEIMEQEVWTKSMTDSVGLQRFYETQKEQYLWGERRDYNELNIGIFKDEKTAQKVAKQAQKMLKKTGDFAAAKVAFEEQGYKVSWYNRSVEKGVNEQVDAIWDQPAGYVGIAHVKENTARIIKINAHLPAGPKELKYVRGTITSAYQEVLEKEWMQQLRQKFPVKVNKTVFQTLK